MESKVVEKKILEEAGNRFMLRPGTAEDVPELFEAVDESREHVGKWMPWLREDYGRDDAAEWVELGAASWESGAAYEFVICDRDDGDRIAGCCGLNHINRIDRVCNLGYWVRSSKLRLGAATQATLLLREFGWHELGFNRLELVIGVGNGPSRGVAERAGAVFEGVQRQRTMAGGAPRNAWMFALLNPLPRSEE